MFDAHAAHLYDYCLSLLTDEAEAASAAGVTLIAAYMLGGRMNEPGQLRAWMFALARRECLSESPARKEPWARVERPGPAGSVNGGSGPAAVAEAETREIARIEPAVTTKTGFEAEIQRAVRLAQRGMTSRSRRPDKYREVLDLVHRHGIAPSELPAILDISAEQAHDLLAAAPVMTSLSTPPAPDPTRRDPPAALASLPGSVWRETASAVFDAEQSSYCQAAAAHAGRLWAAGFPIEPTATEPPSQKKMAMTSVGLAAVLLAPAALGAGLYAVFAASPHSATRSHDYAIVPPSSTQPAANVSSTAARSAARATTRSRAKHAVTSIFPTIPASAPVVPSSPRPTPSKSRQPTSSPPVIRSSSPTVTPTPTPTTPSPSSSLPSPSPAGTSAGPSPSGSSSSSG